MRNQKKKKNHRLSDEAGAEASRSTQDEKKRDEEGGGYSIGVLELPHRPGKTRTETPIPWSLITNRGIRQANIGGGTKERGPY